MLGKAKLMAESIDEWLLSICIKPDCLQLWTQSAKTITCKRLFLYWTQKYWSTFTSF